MLLKAAKEHVTTVQSNTNCVRTPYVIACLNKIAYVIHAYKKFMMDHDCK